MTTANIMPHPEYSKMLPFWDKIEDSVTPGAVKAKGQTYLPASGNQKSDPDRYAAYKKRAVFYAYAQNTLAGVVGMMFKGGVTVEDADPVDYINRNVDGKGVSIQQQARSLGSDLEAFGRGGLLVDYPAAEDGLSKAQQSALGLFATIQQYDAKSIINWSTKNIGSEQVYDLIQLSEVVTETAQDGITTEEIQQERRLLLDDEGNYKVEIYRETELIAEYWPRDASGALFNRIQFFFAGAENNDSKVDNPPLWPITELNLAHYINSADYEHFVYLLSVAQPWASGLDTDALNGIQFGSGIIGVPSGEQMGILQVQPNSLPMEAMEHKRGQMIALGAKQLQSEGAAFNSATEALMAGSSSNSQVETLIQNVESCYNMALESLAAFMGLSTVPTLSIDTDLDALMTDPQVASVIVASWQQGLIPAVDARAYMRRTKLIERTEEEITDDLEQQGGIDLDQDDKLNG